MFRRTLIQAAAALACAAAIPSAFAFAEGTDYVALSAPLPGGEGKLVKVWSYDCPFCFKYDAGVDPKMVPMMEKATGGQGRDLQGLSQEGRTLDGRRRSLPQDRS